MTDWSEKVTVREAYLGMYEFLRRHYERRPTDEIGGLLGGLSKLSDGGSADPAMDQEFLDALEAAVNGRVNAKLSLG